MQGMDNVSHFQNQKQIMSHKTTHALHIAIIAPGTFPREAPEM